MPDGELAGDDRSVSEVVGYVIIFALVISVIGFITALGMPTLEGVQENEQAANAERAFDVVADNMGAVYERNAPSRATEIDLGDSEIYYGDNVTMTVEAGFEEYEREFRPVILRVNDDTSLVYEGGAVFREERNGGFVLRDSPFLLSEDRVHVPIVKTTAPAIESAGGTTILLRGKSANRSEIYSGSGDVTIEIESPRYEIWEQHFEEHPGVEDPVVDEAEQSVEASIDGVDTVLVTEQRIEVSLIL